MKLYIKKLLMLMAIAFAVSGCKIVYRFDTEITDKGGSFGMVMAMDEQLYEMMGQMGESDAMALEMLEKIMIDDSEYYGYRIDKKLSSHEEMEKLLCSPLETSELANAFGSDGIMTGTIFSDVKVNAQEFRGTLSDNMKEFFGDALEEMASYNVGIEGHFSVSFPRKISDTNGELSKDGKSVTWKMQDVLDKEIYAVAPKSSAWWMWLLAAAALAGVAGLFLSKRNNHIQGSYQPTVYEPSEEEIEILKESSENADKAMEELAKALKDSNEEIAAEEEKVSEEIELVLTNDEEESRE